MKRIIIVVTALAALLLFAAEPQPRAAGASNPGTTVAPLLSCPNVTGDLTGGVSAPDFFAVLGQFGRVYPALNFSYLYDLDANDAVAASDFFNVLGEFGVICPLVDAQVAQATLAVLAMGPGVIDCDPAALAAQGYYPPSPIDAPGQGLHYTNSAYDDSVFDPLHPEGLVCDNLGGRLVAQLYYVEGDPAQGGVGWGPVVPPPADDVDIDAFCAPQPPNTTACSWDGDEGWHVHFNLCSINMGTPSAMVLPQPSAADCEAWQCSPDPAPCGAVQGIDWKWEPIVGWMGHLWNHKLNPNLVPDTGGMNGRFADCIPDGSGWKAYTCPQ